jgi:hypothetical protein
MQTEVSADLKKNQRELKKDLYHLIFFPYNHKKKKINQTKNDYLVHILAA